MNGKNQPRDLGMAARTTRSRGRTGRTMNANARLTVQELELVLGAAKKEGKAVGEWAREVLLSHARRGRAEGAVFTELIALRLLLNAVLRAVVLGRKMSEAEYDHLLTEVRQIKHETAQDVLSQYTDSKQGGQ